jgi:hypothetical protein
LSPHPCAALRASGAAPSSASFPFQTTLGSCIWSLENGSKLFLVCGVYPVSDGFAINIRQLRVLLGECKSSIKGSFQHISEAEMK